MVWDFFGLKVLYIDKDGKAVDDGSARCCICHPTVITRNGPSIPSKACSQVLFSLCNQCLI